MKVPPMPISPLKVMPLLAALLTALALAGCGSDTTASKAGSDTSPADSSAHEIAAAPTSAVKADGGIIDVCSLVSLADAESILGTPAKLSEHQPDDKRSSSCHFDSVDETHSVNNLMVEIHTDDDVNEAKQDIAMQKQLWGGAEALPGIGDDALLSGNKQPSVGEDAPAAAVAMLPDQQILIAIKGARKIQIMTNYFGKPRPTDSLKALGKKLADHI